jgi:hypothetical protein
METWPSLAVTHQQALRFFFERLKDVIEPDRAPTSELLYNASILAHFASTSAASVDGFPPCPTGLTTVFDLFVVDRSHASDPEIMEAAGSQCLLLTGFFEDQLRRRHNVDWYASIGAGFFGQAARHSRDRARTQMLSAMAARFEVWRRRQHRLAHELCDEPRLVAIRRALSDAPSDWRP